MFVWNTAPTWFGGDIAVFCSQNNISQIIVRIPPIIPVVSENGAIHLSELREAGYYFEAYEVCGMNCKATWQVSLCNKRTICTIKSLEEISQMIYFWVKKVPNYKHVF